MLWHRGAVNFPIAIQSVPTEASAQAWRCQLNQSTVERRRPASGGAEVLVRIPDAFPHWQQLGLE